MGPRPRPRARSSRRARYLDAHDESLLEWIAESQISALVADNYAVEGLLGKDRDPSRHSFLPIHHLCLFKLGVPLGELWYLHELATWLREHDRSRFLLTAPPLRLPGHRGLPAHPDRHRLTVDGHVGRARDGARQSKPVVVATRAISLNSFGPAAGVEQVAPGLARDVGADVLADRRRTAVRAAALSIMRGPPLLGLGRRPR